ncbi:Gfo/Idh/MocA family protein [Metabacillus dongyingensis]|uniref:Gfo/Idh/MocA family protein n=1 Tax=Metabacillus dongyingensis TaxID=2874282 RepID=UPI001CBFEF8E|nr:Gfo/Idh/MocA family oxidoreductase [Metabacillus dongyingensis]UAL52119.1 Gfo/Idh/MocA family oxidoreductase [Metabacillus dongyingensis]
MISVAMLSKWHVHAVDYERDIHNSSKLNITHVWDEDKERGQRWANELNVPFEPELEKVLGNPAIEGVVVDTPTNMHKEVIIKAAQNGKHIFTEKVLALTTADCKEIFEAVEKAGVSLVVSMPRLTTNYYLYAEKALKDGLIGELKMARCRVAHNGSVPSAENPEGWLPAHFYNAEQCGGGALIDLGAHPIYLLNRLAGKPKEVSAHFDYVYTKEVEDQASVIVSYEEGVTGVIETSFVSHGSPFYLELYGTEGCLLIQDGKVELRNGEGTHVIEQLPKELPIPMEQWADAIQSGKTPSISNEDALLLTAVNEAAIQSNTEKRRITIIV